MTQDWTLAIGESRFHEPNRRETGFLQWLKSSQIIMIRKFKWNKESSGRKILQSVFGYLCGVVIYILVVNVFKVSNQTLLSFWIIALLILVLFNQSSTVEKKEKKAQHLLIKDVALDFTLSMFIAYGCNFFW